MTCIFCRIVAGEIPAEVVAKDEAKLKALKAGGKPVLASK